MWRLRRGAQPLVESEAFWAEEMAEGRVLIRRRKRQKEDPEASWVDASPEDIVQPGDSVLVLLHSHERVVPVVRPTLLHQTEELVVVDKPAGLACSKDPDLTNSLGAVVREELHLEGLHLAHRLDVCVTGCLIFARTRKLVQKVHAEMEQGNVRKVYLARVRGKLPTSLHPGPSSVCWEPMVGEGQAIAQDRPSMCIKQALSYDGHAARAFVDLDGKSCETVVTWLATFLDGTHILHCCPTTGRKHQIRCHLEAIGLPVANDVLYGGQQVAATSESLVYNDDGVGTLQRNFGPDSACFRIWCPKCHNVVATLSGELAPPELGSGEIWLRSWRYCLPSMGIDVEAPLPSWVFQNNVAL